MVKSTLLLVPIFSTVVHAANDWRKPCFQGECFYNLPQSQGSPSGTLKIWGSPNAISDITTAAGWTILGCDKNALAQDIRLVCNSDDTVAAGCSHLYQDIGATGKIVRLPENCGKSAFARVSRTWVPKDQSIPSDIAARLTRRDGSAPEVLGLSLDTNFAAIDPSRTGIVSIVVQGSTVPGTNGILTVPPASFRRGHAHRRGLISFVENAHRKFTSFNENSTKTLPPIDIDMTFPVLEEKISCPASGPIPAINGSIKAAVLTKTHAVVQIGVAASGTIIPPKLDEFGLFAGLDATLGGTLDLSASASGTVDSGEITLYQAGIPGLSFPGILEIGPTFKVLGETKVTLDVDVDMKVGFSYTVSNAKLFFPSSYSQKSGGDFTPGDTPLKLSVSPSVASKGIIEAHLIPRIDVGITVLSGIATATVYLDLDASAAVTLSLNATTQSNATVPHSSAVSTKMSDPVARSDVADKTGNVNGCIDVGAALDVNAGAQGKLFGILDQSTKVNLFHKHFDLFTKCIGTSALSKRTVPHILRRSSMPANLACLTSDLAALVSVADEMVPGGSIHAAP